ncbi:hypothetical protein GCM10009753_20860 [Streptantibioticus ferralitis]
MSRKADPRAPAEPRARRAARGGIVRRSLATRPGRIRGVLPRPDRVRSIYYTVVDVGWEAA